MLVAEADSIHLDAGTYHIEAPLPALLLVSVNRSTTRLLRTDSEPMTATLNTGDYRFSIYTKDKTTNLSFTPPAHMRRMKAAA